MTPERAFALKLEDRCREAELNQAKAKLERLFLRTAAKELCGLELEHAGRRSRITFRRYGMDGQADRTLIALIARPRATIYVAGLLKVIASLRAEAKRKGMAA